MDGNGERRILSCDNLARDFGAASHVAREGVAAFYRALTAGHRPSGSDAVSRWRAYVDSAFGHVLDNAAAGWEGLARLYKMPADPIDPSAMLLSIHTYYALLVKVTVWQVLAHRFGVPGPVQMAGAGEREPLRREMEQWEQGGVLGETSLFAISEQDPFSWYLAAWDEPVERATRKLAAEIGRYDPTAPGRGSSGACDLFRDVYQALFPKGLRHALGQYYTPDWLAEHLLEEVGYSGQAGKRLLDPACGSGAFLVAAIRRIRADASGRSGQDRDRDGDLAARILASVVGFDLDPMAAGTARANYLIAICDLLPAVAGVSVSVHLRDSILSAGPVAGSEGPRFDYVVGNPPWIAWDHLPGPYREATKPLWQSYGLFSLSGTAARHGGGKKDLSMLMLYVAADRYLKDRGRLGLVITQTPFQTKGAGDGFRRFRLGDAGPRLRVLRVHDMAEFQPFPGAANWTSTVILEKGSPTVYPVPYVKWSLEHGSQADRAGAPPRFRRRLCEAEPIDPNRPTSPWLVRPQGIQGSLLRLIGPSDYEAHLGANSGGANGVYWVHVLGFAEGGVRIRNSAGRAKRSVETVEQGVESALVYPLLRWGDVARYRADPSAYILLAQDVVSRRGIEEATLQERYPNAHRYFRRFQGILESRVAYRRYQGDAAFWSMYDVGPYTVAPIKVVWRRMDGRINAAVADSIDDPWLGVRPVIPQETCVLIPAESLAEAHYLCAVLNSSVVSFLVRGHSVRGGKGFGTPSILDFLRLRRFDPADQRHAELAACAREAHACVRRGADCGELQRWIDGLVGRLWGLDVSELEAIDREENG